MTRIADLKLKCPCCRKTFISSVWISTNKGPISTDFYQTSFGLQPMHFEIHTCIFCGYSGYSEDFDKRKIDKALKAMIEERIGLYICRKGVSPEKKYEYAAWIGEASGENSLDIGRLYLKAAWCFPEDCGHGKRKKKRYYRRKAIEHFEMAWQGKEIPKRIEVIFLYLIGELFRRVGEGRKAVLWFDYVIEALEENPERAWLLDLADQQRTRPRETMIAYDEEVSWFSAKIMSSVPVQKWGLVEVEEGMDR